MDERANRILKAIEESGLSYVELSKLTGISKSSLQRYATGETKKIPIDSIELIANATHSDARYLMGWEDEKTAPAETGESEDKEFEKLYKSLTESEQADVRQYVAFKISQRGSDQ